MANLVQTKHGFFLSKAKNIVCTLVVKIAHGLRQLVFMMTARLDFQMHSSTTKLTSITEED